MWQASRGIGTWRAIVANQIRPRSHSALLLILQSHMATFSMESPPSGEATLVASEEDDASALLANALQKMDGLIGDYRLGL